MFPEVVCFLLLFVGFFFFSMVELGKRGDEHCCLGCSSFVFRTCRKEWFALLWLGLHPWLCFTWVTFRFLMWRTRGLVRRGAVLLPASSPALALSNSAVPGSTKKEPRELSRRLNRENNPSSSRLAGACLMAGDEDYLFWWNPTVL